MKRVLGVVVVALALALGVWGGVHTWPSASVAMNMQAGLAIVVGCNLVLCLWVWYRAPRGSGDTIMPVIALLMAAMLTGNLPRLFWPAAEGIHIAGSIASMIVTTVAVVMLIRRRRPSTAAQDLDRS